MAKPASIDQPYLINVVLDFVQKFVPDFNSGDLVWVRSTKTSKLLNCQCRSVMRASMVRSTFASIVKTKPTPAFIGKVCNRSFNYNII